MAGLIKNILGGALSGAGESAQSSIMQEQRNKAALDLEKKKTEILASRNKALSKAKTWGSVVRTKIGDKNYLAGMTYNEDTGESNIVQSELPGELVSVLGETGKEQTEREIIESGGKKGAELDVRIEKEPTLEGLKTTAKEEAKAGVKKETDKQKKLAAYKTYQVGMDNLMSAIGDTATGPFVGRIPAITSDAQKTEKAISLMAPILKSIFRESGEGQFTDKDQDLLLNMIPDRKDRKEVVESQFKAIDALIKAKLDIREEDLNPVIEPKQKVNAGALAPSEGFNSLEEEKKSLLKSLGFGG